MSPFPLSPSAFARACRAVALLGLVAAVVGTVAAWGLLGRAEAALAESLALTGDTLAALDASAGVAADSLEVLGASLAALEATAEDLDSAFVDGEVLLGDLAELVRGDVASSVGAIDDALPGLITVAGTIDGTLAALSRLPFGPSYDPEQSFADALRTVSTSLDGLPSQLREQADLIDEATQSLQRAGTGVVGLVGDVAGFEATLSQTQELLDTYATTIADGRELVAETGDELGPQIALGRFAAVLLGLAFAGLQLVPLQLAATTRTAGPASVGSAGP